MSDVLEDLLDRRLLLVTGKGGTGKTTVSVSLALLAARRGLNTVLIEVSDENASTPLLEDRPGSIPDGNGRVARFVMNALFASAGYPWTVIRVHDRAEYLKALERASVGGDLRPFAAFVKSQMESSISTATGFAT